MAKPKISLGKGHNALENMWVIFKYLDIDFYHNSTVIREQTLYDFISIPLNFCTLFYVPGYILESPSLQPMGT